MRSALNRSAVSSRANSPRRFTQGPRLVEVATSGATVTIACDKGVSSRAMSFRICPKPICVDMALSPADGVGRLAGTEIVGATWRLRPLAKKGAVSTCACSTVASSLAPHHGCHS